MSKITTSHENYVQLLDALRLKRKTPFNVKAFIRFIQPYCKTTNNKDRILFINIRGSKFGLKIQVLTLSYFIVTDNKQDYEFHLFADTTKQLLYKLIKHNLLKP